VTDSHRMLARARLLRKESTPAELLLWKHLRARRLAGYKFRRQVVIGDYIVDFICHEACLIVEADGGQHSEQAAYDRKRTLDLEACGYRVLRFWNHEIMNNLDDVLEEILRALEQPPSP
jgi:very-short-patch-repair endonuclease